jgi:hypothetical protein
MVKSSKRDFYIPYRILCYLLYAEVEWFEVLEDNQIRIFTPEASRSLSLRHIELREALDRLEEMQLITGIRKERRRGTILLTLVAPTNFSKE